MEGYSYEIEKLLQELKDCQKLLVAIGDKVRQCLLCAILQGECNGTRGVELAKKVNIFILKIMILVNYSI